MALSDTLTSPFFVDSLHPISYRGLTHWKSYVYIHWSQGDAVVDRVALGSDDMSGPCTVNAVSVRVRMAALL